MGIIGEYLISDECTRLLPVKITDMLKVYVNKIRIVPIIVENPIVYIILSLGLRF